MIAANLTTIMQPRFIYSIWPGLSYCAAPPANNTDPGPYTDIRRCKLVTAFGGRDDNRTKRGANANLIAFYGFMGFKRDLFIMRESA